VRLTRQFWGALAAIAAVLILLSVIWRWVFPTTKDFLDYISPVSIEVIVNFGTGQPFPLGPANPMDNTRKNKLKKAIVSFVLVNASNRPYESSYRFMIKQLPAPIIDVQVLAYTLLYGDLESCSGKPFKSELFAGKNSFCIQFKTFPGRGIAQILLVFEQNRGPTINMDRIFKGPKNNVQRERPIELVDIFAEIQELKNDLLFNYIASILLSVLLLMMLCVLLLWKPARR